MSAIGFPCEKLWNPHVAQFSMLHAGFDRAAVAGATAGTRYLKRVYTVSAWTSAFGDPEPTCISAQFPITETIGRYSGEQFSVADGNGAIAITPLTAVELDPLQAVNWECAGELVPDVDGNHVRPVYDGEQSDTVQRWGIAVTIDGVASGTFVVDVTYSEANTQTHFREDVAEWPPLVPWDDVLAYDTAHPAAQAWKYNATGDALVLDTTLTNPVVGPCACSPEDRAAEYDFRPTGVYIGNAFRQVPLRQWRRDFQKWDTEAWADESCESFSSQPFERTTFHPPAVEVGAGDHRERFFFQWGEQCP